MAKSSTNPLKFNHISKAVKESLEYIDGRRKGKIKSLKTGLDKLDSSLLDGIEWNKIFSIGAMSGSGKSVLCEQLKRGILKHNKSENIKFLSFEFEMPSYEQVTRNLSGIMKKSTGELYSKDTAITDEEYEEIVENSNRFKYAPVWTVDNVGNVDQIVNSILVFRDKVMKEGDGIVVTLDHALLTSMKFGESERNMLAYLYRSIVALKKKLVSEGVKCLFIILNQLNRDIEKLDRKNNPDYHYPNRNDIFGSNDIFMGSDYVLIVHKPAILGLEFYGPPKGSYTQGLPVYNPQNPSQAMIYFHLIKQRSGQPRIMMMLDDFKNSRILEY